MKANSRNISVILNENGLERDVNFRLQVQGGYKGVDTIVVALEGTTNVEINSILSETFNTVDFSDRVNVSKK
jgi:hypothetical protein